MTHSLQCIREQEVVASTAAAACKHATCQERLKTTSLSSASALVYQAAGGVLAWLMGLPASGQSGSWPAMVAVAAVRLAGGLTSVLGFWRLRGAKQALLPAEGLITRGRALFGAVSDPADPVRREPFMCCMAAICASQQPSQAKL